MKIGFILVGAAALTFAGASIAQTYTPPMQDATTATPGQGQSTADQARTGGKDFGQSVSEQRHERNKARKERKHSGTTGSGTQAPQPSPTPTGTPTPTPTPEPTATPTDTPTPTPEANPTPDATPTPRG